eukprot:TRINITY_DN7109_c0_g2_i1.p1 TRINITY_DN7109_c0_g2~~TRINITY_DN7109_c0_g2_i1.p1  ORF type:complete len:250 (+),score=21.50 TRINITY_DN7109_c0_g2_i1:52-801(+)
MAMPSMSSVPENSFSEKFRMQFSKTKMCKFYKKGQCNRGGLCMFAHGKEELQARPDLDKTALCPLRQTCTDPVCKYAHCISELRRTEQFAKTTPCRYHLAGGCKLGDDCLHSHSGGPQIATTGDSNGPCAYDPLPPWSRSTTPGTVASTFEDSATFSRASTTSTLSGVASSSSVLWPVLWPVTTQGQYSGAQQPPTWSSTSTEGMTIPTAWLRNGGISSSAKLVAVGNSLVAVGETLEGSGELLDGIGT